MAIAIDTVGTCSGCGGPVRLRLDQGRRSASCDQGCWVSLLPESFFAANGFGDAARVSRRSRIAHARSAGRGALVVALERISEDPRDVDEGVAVTRQWRVRWQRLGMSRPRVRTFESEAPARRHALRLQGRIAEVYPDKEPEGYYCCPGTASYECGCGGRTNAEEWARQSALIPPLIVGPVIDSREVGEWTHEDVVIPEPVPPEVVQAFRDGGERWPIPVLVGATSEGDGDDIPF